MTDDLTGRDDYILAKALYQALKYQQDLPEWLQSPSDADDMRHILSSRFPERAEDMTLIAEANFMLIRGMRKPDGMTEEQWSERLEQLRKYTAPLDLVDEKRHRYFTGEPEHG